MTNKQEAKKKKYLYVSDLWADTANDSASLGSRLENLEQQMFELKKTIKQIKIKLED
jgi:hypothetical protein